MSLLEVDDLSVHFAVKTPLFGKKKFLRAVNGVSFKMEKGEIIGLAFDGNKESMASDVWYMPGYNKCVCVAGNARIVI